MVARNKNLNFSEICGVDKKTLSQKVAGVYKISCKVNEKVYIGRSDDIYNRWKNHIRVMAGRICGNKNLSEDGIKYGLDKFTFEILETCESGYDAFYLGIEKKYIDFYKSTDPKHGYNILKGF
jgi:group I intron endonuclease